MTSSRDDQVWSNSPSSLISAFNRFQISVSRFHVEWCEVGRMILSDWLWITHPFNTPMLTESGLPPALITDMLSRLVWSYQAQCCYMHLQHLSRTLLFTSLVQGCLTGFQGVLIKKWGIIKQNSHQMGVRGQIRVSLGDLDVQKFDNLWSRR